MTSKSFEGYVTVLEVTENEETKLKVRFAHIFLPGNGAPEKDVVLIFPISLEMLTALSSVYPAQKIGRDSPYEVYVSYEEDQNGKPAFVRQIRIPPNRGPSRSS